MRMNRRAEGGFLEAMVALMIATVAVSAFIGVMIYSSVMQADDTPDISTDFINCVRIEDGEIVGVDESYIQNECATKCYKSMTIKIVSKYPNETVSLSIGTSSDSDYGYERCCRSIPCDDGSMRFATFEVVAYY